MFFYKRYTPGLAINSFIVGDTQSKKCVVIDPVRDISQYVHLAHKEHLSIEGILETHVHADFVSGACELKHRLNDTPKIYCSGLGGDEWIPTYADVVVSDGMEVSLGTIRLKAIHTPGHTPEHVMWALYDDTRSSETPWLIFTGDFVFVGSIGRPDLLGAKELKTLSHQLYSSVFDTLPQYPDFVEIYPSHGEGSMCGKSLGSRNSSTLGYEMKFNESLQKLPEGQWIQQLMENMPSPPAYFSRMKRVNVEGPPIIGDKIKSLKRLSANQVNELFESSCVVVDTRSKESFSELHIPGSISLPYGKNMSTWGGWALPYDIPFIFVFEEESQLHDVITQLLLVGFDNIEGYLEGGISSWEQEGLPTDHIDTLSVQDLANRLKEESPPYVVDIRRDSEWSSGHITNAHHIPLGTVSEGIESINKNESIAVICRTGYRSSIAASLMKRKGYHHVANVFGGMSAWHKKNFSVER